MNRGIARRSVFEDRPSVRYFFSRLARVVREGDLEVHCFVFLKTHDHLPVRTIDQNPVMAGLVHRPEAYPHGSARRYEGESGPPWLERSWVEMDRCEQVGRRAQEPSVLTPRSVSQIGGWIEAHEVELVEAHFRGER